jgi:hypothetical protein
VPAFYCPSDVTFKGMPWRYSATNYGSNFLLLGTVAQPGKGITGSCQYMTLLSQYAIPTVPDGTSNTILLSEMYSCYGSACTDRTNWAEPLSYSWGGLASNVVGCHIPTCFGVPSFVTDTVNATLPPQGKVAGYYRSTAMHPNACPVALVDGSVRLVSLNITSTTWLAALTPDDGTVLGGDW